MKQTQSKEGDSRDSGAARVFATTRWSVVLSARTGQPAEAAAALESLCAAYWYPLYAHVRRLGYSQPDAEDLTQAFFARLLEKEWIAAADKDRGRFRSFLLSALRHYVANEWDRARAQKRGGGHQIVSLDAMAGEERLKYEPATTGAPDREFDRRWALTLLDRVLARLASEYAEGGKARLFEQLKGTLVGGQEGGSYQSLSAELGISAGALRVAAHRLRGRYRELLRDEIAQTVSDASAVEDELRELFAALSR